MEITRKDLIELCDKFLNGEISKEGIENFASNAIFSDDDDWDDEIISDTIFEWDNEEINFPINNVNMELWKKRLNGDEDELLKYNFWNSHIEPQKKICEKFDSLWKPINKKLKIGVSKNLNLDPLNGLRHNSEKGTTGWFIWSGEYSENDDFFEPICAEHLLQIRPEIIDYLGLDVGFRFLIDKNGYEDIWFDKKISKI
ncbi:immunity protein Imm33 domain-containing protein [Flavobacterium caeni]|uniref:Imm33-like domain-containing protein n=1 Tax=Flavobacterium caeni TaxID=490189 RepID=A0A1G5KEA7_9FLAO|nr:hypothetical protein [Flavobacterium caeni]SCY98973.1 hypothetical protein SAMN02927903_03263 [Flavobacterium caeni]